MTRTEAVDLPLIGGPRDGESHPLIAPKLKVPGFPILKTTWDGEMFIHHFTIHTYRYDREAGAFTYQGAAGG